jgi:hypothetical protein
MYMFIQMKLWVRLNNKEQLAELDESSKVHSRKKGWGLKAYYQGNEGLKTHSKEKG